MRWGVSSQSKRLVMPILVRHSIQLKQFNSLSFTAFELLTKEINLTANDLIRIYCVVQSFDLE